MKTFARTCSICVLLLLSCCLLYGCGDSSSSSKTGSTEAKVGTTPLTTARINFNPDIVVSAQLSAEEAAGQYLAVTVPEHADHLIAKLTRHSLLASHVIFEYVVDDMMVWGSGAAVSVNMNNGQVLRSFLNLPEDLDLHAAHAAAAATPDLIDAEQAKETAWQHVGVSGDLLSPLQCQLLYRRHQQQYIPSYRVRLHVAEPHGVWRVWVSAVDGSVLAVESERITCKPMTWPDFSVARGASTDRRAAEQQLTARMAIPSAASLTWLAPAPSGFTGQANIFDPDPVTVLADDSLTLDTPLSVFEAAYTTVTLKNLSQTADGSYRLCGPHVCIEDFEAPATPPSSTTDGIWDAPRGEPEFWEAMIYHHIDSNQRYLKSLGYLGERGLVDYPLVADADGARGEDNSYFSPDFDNNPKITFGHGGAPDAEDADVILHEYAHALQYAIGPQTTYGSGDTGAIAEGMADYWAASWSLRSEAGQLFLPNQVFQWDALGWGGRQLDAKDVWYDPDQTYRAHQSFLVGEKPDFSNWTDEDWDNWQPVFWSADELWSRPLYLSLQRLLALGYLRHDMDKIVLESFFGLGSDITMRDLAGVMVHTAHTLFPNGSHSEILKEEFEAVNIL